MYIYIYIYIYIYMNACVNINLRSCLGMIIAMQLEAGCIAHKDQGAHRHAWIIDLWNRT